MKSAMGGRMFESLNFNAFCLLAKKGKRVAVFKEFSADLITPMSAKQALLEITDDLVLFESGELRGEEGRFSHIGFSRIAEIKAFGSHVEIEEEGKKSWKEERNPYELLRFFHQKYRCVSLRDQIGFAGGTAGYCSYDAIRYVENIPNRNQSQKSFPDLFFQFFDKSITFDHIRGVVTIIKVALTCETLKQEYQKALNEIDQIYTCILKPPQIISNKDKQKNLEIRVTPNDEHFKKWIEKAKQYISSGDVFQVVLSRRFQAKLSVSPDRLYRAIRRITPSPYMFFFAQKDFSIAGASPEKLVSLKYGIVETVPLAGTRKRVKRKEEDAKSALDLLNDPKERAEHLMLVDLGRNDLGMISKPGSVNVKELMQVFYFSHVMHLGSVIQGEIESDLDAFDAIQATLPAGTLSGAPKIRAMEIIDEMEPFCRGPYGGAICLVDHLGNLDSCIGIRMATIQDNVATVQAGMGIVYDSDLQKEADESRQKAEGILEAIFLAEEGKV